MSKKTNVFLFTIVATILNVVVTALLFYCPHVALLGHLGTAASTNRHRVGSHGRIHCEYRCYYLYLSQGPGLGSQEIQPR